MNYEKLKQYIQAKFKSVSNPNLLMNDKDFLRIFNAAYFNIFHTMPAIYQCGVCMFEHYQKISQLTELQIKHRLSMKNTIKPGVYMFAANGRPYTRESGDITAEVIAELQEKHPYNFEEIQQIEIPELSDELPQHPAIKATPKKRK